MSNVFKYSIFDPSKNITALVVSEVNESDVGTVSNKIMEQDSTVEQVGFISFDDGSDITLRMAGGEFCGNATMSAAVYFCDKKQFDKKDVKVTVYGSPELIDVHIERESHHRWTGIIDVPMPLEIKDVEFSSGKVFPTVFFNSIAHVIIYSNGQQDISKKDAELVIKEWCKSLNVLALGLMYYDTSKSELTPLVYVASINSLFWEKACASGTAAIGAYELSKGGKPISISVRQPGGDIIDVICDGSKIRLKGRINYVADREIVI